MIISTVLNESLSSRSCAVALITVIIAASSPADYVMQTVSTQYYAEIPSRCCMLNFFAELLRCVFFRLSSMAVTDSGDPIVACRGGGGGWIWP